MATANDPCADVTDEVLVAALAARIKQHHANYRREKDPLRAAAKAAASKARQAKAAANRTGDPDIEATKTQEAQSEDAKAAAAKAAAAKVEDKGEDLFEKLLDLVGVQKFTNYWKLGDIIYDENPYFDEDEITFDIDANKIRVAGALEKFKADDPFPGINDGENPPKALHADQDIAKGNACAWYYRLGSGSAQLGRVDLGNDTPADKEKYERNIVKELEIEYGPEIVEYDKDGKELKRKAPHIICLLGGGDH